jgi:hypothetical protein
VSAKANWKNWQKHQALAELERRGYEVRGKTPAQIREMLKRRPKISVRAK